PSGWTGRRSENAKGRDSGSEIDYHTDESTTLMRGSSQVVWCVLPVRQTAHCPVSATHTFTVLSSLPETIRLPSAENATLVTWLVCPLRVSSSCPVCASHTFTVLSSLPEAIRLPSAENATLQTALVCPWRVRASFPVFASHTFIVP